MQIDPMHAARLAQLEGALCALLRAAAFDHEPNQQPDSITLTFGPNGLDLEYLRGVVPVGGEGF